MIVGDEGPSHTFAVCAYKESPYLRECLDSVLSQKGQRSEVYVATSTPNAWIENLVQEYGLPLYVNEGDSGIGQDWNFAYSKATCDYVTIAHQDDIYCEDYARVAVERMDEADNPLIFFCDYGELRNGERVNANRLLTVKRILLRGLKDKKNSSRISVRRHALSLGSAICCPSVCISRVAFPEPPFKLGMKSNLDWDTWETISRREGDFCYAPQILMYHRIHEDSTTSQLIANNTRAQEDYEMLARFWPSPVAKMLYRLYSRGMGSNRLQ